MGIQLLREFREEKIKTKKGECGEHGKTTLYYDRDNSGYFCLKCHEEWLDKQIDNPMSTYPSKAKISKNKHVANCYRKIRTVFRDKYIREKFMNPLMPREEEFLQWIKFYLNDLEEKLCQSKN